MPRNVNDCFVADVLCYFFMKLKGKPSAAQLGGFHHT